MISAWLFAAALAGPTSAEPFIPTDDAQVLERLSSRLSSDPETRRLRAELTADPGNLELALDLARRYLESGRVEGDPRYQGYAQAALARSCLPLRRSEPLLAAACLAGAASLGGGAEGGYEMLSRALAGSWKARPEDRFWALTTLAEIAARLGRDEAAEGHFEAALALDARDVYVLGAYADFLLDAGRPQAVRELLAGESRSDALLLRLALAEARLGSGESREHREHLESLEARFAENRLRGGGLHLGAESRFRLELRGEPAEALRLARDNWAVQREPADARRLLEAALAAGDREAARPVLDWMAASGLEDVRLADLARRLDEEAR